MKTVIVAGGKGTRISSVASDIPKPMIKIGGIPVLEHEINCLKSQGLNDIILTVSHLGHVIMDYFLDGKKFGVNIDYYYENNPMGNAGALFKIRDKLSEDFLLLNADSIFDIDFLRFISFHKKHQALATIMTHPNSHPYDSGLIISDDGLVNQWLTKEDQRPKYYSNRVNAGIHILKKKLLYQFPYDIGKIGNVDTLQNEIAKVDLDRDILKPLAGTGKLFCYDSPEYVKDMGTPERYKTVNEDYLNGLIHSKNLRYKQKAIFLDRDGTINKYVGFLNDIQKFELIEGVAEAIKEINNSEYLAIVVTNQPVVARGEITEEGLKEIHKKMETLLGEKGAYVDGIYYCPHHPHKGFENEVPELKINCDCRKPKPGMLFKAMIDYNLDLSQSWIIGDSQNDILAGKNAGCKTALIGNGDYGQDLTVSNLKQFVSERKKC